MAGAKRDLKKLDHLKERVVEFLEKALKRANRLFKSVVGTQEFASQSQEWQSHLRWMEYHNTYFKPLFSPATGRLERRKSWLDTLMQMSEKAILELRYELPDPAELHAVVHQFLTYSLRGRMGECDHIFMVRNKDSSVAQLKLLEFVQKRLVFKGGTVTKPSKKTKQTKGLSAEDSVTTKARK